MTSASDEKCRPSNFFFNHRKQVVAQRDQIRRIGWVIKTLEAQVGRFLPGCKCPLSRGIVVQEQDPLGDLPAAFSQKNLFHQPQYPLNRKVGWPHSGSGRFGKDSSYPYRDSNPGLSSPQLTHCADWAIPAFLFLHTRKGIRKSTVYNVKYLNDIRWVRQNTTLYYDVMCHRTDSMFRPFTIRPSSGLTSRVKEEIVKL